MADLQGLDQYFRNLAVALGAMYLQLSDFHKIPTPKRQQAKPCRYLFANSTYAFGVWQPGDPIQLICLSFDSTWLFKEILREALELDDLSVPADGGFVLRNAPSGTQIKLYHCLPLTYPPKAPKRLHLQEAERSYAHQWATANMIEVFERIESMPASAETCRAAQNTAHEDGIESMSASAATCQAAQKPAREDGIFSHSWSRLRSWALAMGLLAPEVGLLEIEELLKIVGRAFFYWTNQHLNVAGFDSDFIEWFFTNDGRDVLEEAPPRESVFTALKTAYEHVKSNATSAKLTATEITEAEAVKLALAELTDIDQTEGFNIFASQYDLFNIVTLECYEPKLQKHYAKTATKYINDVVKKLWDADVACRPWPKGHEQKFVLGLELPLSTFDVTVSDPEGYVVSILQCSQDELPQHFSPPQRTIQTTAPPDTKAEGSLAPLESGAEQKRKFRSASEALSRLRWDPAHTGTAYEVAYLDRFEGLKWISLESWGEKDTEEEDFIPEHRIRRIRRVGDGVVVWDREKRVDLTGEASS